MNLALHLQVVGILQLLLAAAHLFLPKHLGWKEDFAKVCLLNRQIFYVHTFFIALLLVLIGLLTVFGVELLLRRDALTCYVLGGLVAFWGIRCFFQLFVYDSRLWRGHRFNTVIHVLATSMWGYYVAVYGLAFLRQL